MADRFPSLEEFDSGGTSLPPTILLHPTAPILTYIPAQTEAQGSSGFENNDFLSREKALLGDDADQFATGNESKAYVEDGDDDLLGGGNMGGNEEVTEFESSFPVIGNANEVCSLHITESRYIPHLRNGRKLSTNDKQNVGTGGSITNTTPFQSSYAPPSFSDEEEPEVLKQWRARRDAALSERETRSAERKEETVKAAQQNIDDFYENYNSKKEKTIAATHREAEQFLESREDTSAGGTSWERIAKLVDLSGKGGKGGASGSEKAKFRELLVNLRKDEKAPGATGV